MNQRRAHRFAQGLLALGFVLAACVPSAAPSPTAGSPTQAPSTGPTVIATPTILPAPTIAAVCQAGPGETWVAINGMANLFGAGLDAPPGPGGGGAGLLPPVVDLPADGTRLVTFPCTAGVTDCCGSPPSVGPAGYVGTQSTRVDSHGGISGMLMEGRVMFLAGVFISEAAPAEPAPKRLDFTGNADFRRLRPELGQTFFIGDGAGKTFVAPAGSTRLFLGFVDALVFEGAPGWYGNNLGTLEATVAIRVE